MDMGLCICCPEDNQFRNDKTCRTDNTSGSTLRHHTPRKSDNFRGGHRSALPGPDSGLKEINFSFSRSKLRQILNNIYRITEVSQLLQSKYNVLLFC